MMWGTVQIADLYELLPYGVLTAGGLSHLMAASGRKSKIRPGLIALFTASIVLATFGVLLMTGANPTPFGGLLVHDFLGKGFAAAALLLLLFTLPTIPFDSTHSSSRIHGTLALLLFSVAGALLMVFSNHLLMFFVGLELLSLPLYVLTGFSTSSKQGNEAAFKYFLLGAIASALFIYGTAWLWGSLGTLRLDEIAAAVTRGNIESPRLLMFGAALIMSGLAFKLGLVPFHMWVPDVYEGAPSWLVAWMSGAVKAGTIAFLFRFLSTALPNTAAPWTLVLNLLAVLSMLWGSLAALYQSNIKRMLAYSSVAHAGYIALGLVAAAEGMTKEAAASLVYYVLSYGLASLAAFTVIAVEEPEGHTSVEHFAGLAKRKPAVAFVFAAALLSLAGLPPLAGFVAKFNVFMLAVRGDHFLPVMFGVLTTLVSLGYYLHVIVAVYMKEPSEPKPFRLGKMQLATLGGVAALTLLLGLLPGNILEAFLH